MGKHITLKETDVEVSIKNKETLARELERFGSVSTGIPLDRFTTFRTGGIADILFEPAGEEQLCDALQLLAGREIPCTFIGGGSNLLVSDSGIRGAVIRICRESENPVFSDDLVYAPAWVSKEMFISFAILNSLGGIEFMAGIPGTVGGGIYMNAGTNTGCFSDILSAVKIVRPGGDIETIKTDSSHSLYRKNVLPAVSAILGGYFRLPSSGDSDSVQKSVDQIISERHIKHPMEYPSAGSVFKNPEGGSSWKLINDAGLKGCRYGGAMVSEKHTNFIINTGGATSTDIYNLVRHVQQTVFESSGIMLETEIRLMGDFN